MKKRAHSIHHTHWDLIWYFTVQDADVQFSYNMKEILDAFDNKEINNFYMDGQTAPIDDFINMFPQEEKRMQKYVKSGKLVVGPFNSQLDSFITSGESVINNLRLGIKTSKRLGKTSKIAYLPDSFGHSVDFPKIFNQFGIEDFVITRGVGDEYNLDSEFYLESNDGSKLLVYTMIAGYGYGCYGFKEGTLFSDKAVDYNKINVHQLINRLLDYSTLENEFVFPLGFDQNPMVRHIDERIKEYNEQQKDIEFVETTWRKFLNRVRERGKNLQTHKHELISTQYHRVHRSIYSARADVKAMQDKCERVLTYELQPIMTILDSLGIEYSHGLLDKTWETLVLCQTHSSANLTEETNDYIERETKNALNLAYSHKQYLLKLLSLSLAKESKEAPLIVFNTMPYKRNSLVKAKVFTKSESFSICLANKKVDYTVIQSIQKNHGVLRDDASKIDSDKFHYETDVIFEAKDLKGLSYQTYFIKEEKSEKTFEVDSNHFIENEKYKIYQDKGGVSVLDKETGTLHNQAVYIEDTGDEGDSFDYSYPDKDWKVLDYMNFSNVNYKVSPLLSTMELEGEMMIPKDLEERKNKVTTSKLKYKITLKLEKGSSIIKVSGHFNNDAEQHRVRLIFSGKEKNKFSYVGTQYSIIKRKTYSDEEKYWREKQYFEEPSPIYPLLNHVTAVNRKNVLTIYTRSSKEYEFVSEGYKDIGVTIFRSYGALGYPDLNRRPGRPSGLDYMVFETPGCQMKKKNYFEIAFGYQSNYNENQIFKKYIDYATDSTAYQLQDYDKSINPIDYFPTNPLNKKLPLSHSLLEVKQSEGVYGTIVKSDSSKGYILRLFNSRNTEVEVGKINSMFKNDIIVSNLEEKNEMKWQEKHNKLKPGELRMIKINKGEK